MKDAIKDIINSPDVRRAFTDLVFVAIETLLVRAGDDEDAEEKKEEEE